MSKHLLRGLAAMLFILGACGPGGSGDDVDPTTDARIDGAGSGTIDAPSGTIDAPTGGGSALGMACTGEMQGTCPAGFECLNLEGGSGSWCSKRCTGQSDTSCATGFTGAGFPICLLSVTPAGGGTPVSFCTIICQDEPGAPTLCPGGPTQCNGVCPTPLMCNGAITATAGGPAIGHTCE